jgi:hypothetical protein
MSHEDKRAQLSSLPGASGVEVELDPPLSSHSRSPPQDGCCPAEPCPATSLLMRAPSYCRSAISNCEGSMLRAFLLREADSCEIR